jgi:hypothetical protein
VLRFTGTSGSLIGFVVHLGEPAIKRADDLVPENTRGERGAEQ